MRAFIILLRALHYYFKWRSVHDNVKCVKRANTNRRLFDKLSVVRCHLCKFCHIAQNSMFAELNRLFLRFADVLVIFSFVSVLRLCLSVSLPLCTQYNISIINKELLIFYIDLY